MAVLARAESLPFRSRSFDAALALLTIHQWTSIAAGLTELRRVATRRVVILTCDPACDERFWLASHYLPEIIDLDRRHLPTLGQLEAWLGEIEIREVPIPRDCEEGFLGCVLAKTWSVPGSCRPARDFDIRESTLRRGREGPRPAFG
jgi:hypothetical protein